MTVFKDDPELELGSPLPGEAFLDEISTTAPQFKPGPDGLPMEVTPLWGNADGAPIPLAPSTLSCLAQPERPDHEGMKGNPEMPACQFHRRQLIHNPEAPDRPMLQRFCTHPLLRGINGASMILNDAGIFACEFRLPEDPRATHILDTLDNRKIKLGEERLKQEKDGKGVYGYRMFPTPEDVRLKRFVLDEGDTTLTPFTKTRVDPFAPDALAPKE